VGLEIYPRYPIKIRGYINDVFQDIGSQRASCQKWITDVVRILTRRDSEWFQSIEDDTLRLFDNPRIRALIRNTNEIRLIISACLILGSGYALTVNRMEYYCDGAYTYEQIEGAVNDVARILFDLEEIQDVESDYITSIGVAEDHTVDLVVNSGRVLARKTLGNDYASKQFQFMGKVKECSNVAQLVAVGEVGILFMEACARSISRGLPSGMSVNEMWKQLALGLRCIHENGILHFDLKPENILVCGNQLSITDFGLADYYVPGKEYSVMKYTVMCRPPELNAIWLLTGDEYFKANYKQDIYALGATFYYIMNKYDNDEETLEDLKSGEITQEDYDKEDMNYYISTDYSVYGTLAEQSRISPLIKVEGDELTYIYPRVKLPRVFVKEVENPLLRRMLDSAPSRRPSIEEVVDELL